MTMHMDGAEFYRDSEYNVWSLSSIMAQGDVSKQQLVYRQTIMSCLVGVCVCRIGLGLQVPDCHPTS